METKINVQRLRILATEFGLPYIEEKDGTTISIVGEQQILIFKLNQQEERQCQLIEIY